MRGSMVPRSVVRWRIWATAAAPSVEAAFGAVITPIALTLETAMPTDLSSQYVFLDAAGHATALAGGDAFWSQPKEDLARYGRGWLVSE